MSDDEALALEILRCAGKQGWLPAETVAQAVESELRRPGGRSSRASAEELLQRLLVEQKLTLQQLKDLRQQVSAAWITEEGDQEPEPPTEVSSEFLQTPLPPDRYEIEGLIGRGGMGQVYKARDLRLHRPVALKYLHIADNIRARVTAQGHLQQSAQGGLQRVCVARRTGRRGGLEGEDRR